MGHRRADVVEHALGVLDAYGLADLTMRRLGAELGVQPSALYHHFANKQSLLAAVADEILARGPHGPRPETWDDRATVVCTELREAMLAYRDGAEVVATVHAFGLGATAPGEELVAACRDAGLDRALAGTAARTLLHYVFGHVGDEQTHLQAGSAGAIDGDPRPESDFATGLGIVVDGIRQRVGDRVGDRSGIEKHPGVRRP
ncbi:TetR/AcrR family transcriptional regulator C-terminal domain-containing protein [Nocardioides sp. URHA0032]|uniref:TetR/AcrR family transcriptional regulator C-terminal domain-containing protein n=1 Tax=Nocardioides sp. URHA0032 TaxID=1380388 RepID=UPI000684EB1C|nr:TetR/AcrR family transcriptional regulator C-terminal domain-containing protein [Nocardioides sp. URHA0032]